MRTFVLADNQEITRAGLMYLCEHVTGSPQVCQAVNRKELMEQLLRHPDGIVILDYTLFDLHGVDDLFILHARFPRVDWILFSEDLSPEFLRRVAYSGDPFCLVLKDATLLEIRQAMQEAMRHQCYFCGRVMNLLNDPVKEKEKESQLLTPTEREILKLIASGKTNKEIATIRYSSIHTVNTHRKNIFRKLEVNSVHEATKYALRAGILDVAEYYI